MKVPFVILIGKNSIFTISNAMRSQVRDGKVLLWLMKIAFSFFPLNSLWFIFTCHLQIQEGCFTQHCINAFVAASQQPNLYEISGLASPKYFGGQKFEECKIFDFRLATVFCLGYRFSKHKMTSYSKNLGVSWPPVPPSLRLCMKYVHDDASQRCFKRTHFHNSGWLFSNTSTWHGSCKKECNVYVSLQQSIIRDFSC